MINDGALLFLSLHQLIWMLKFGLFWDCDSYEPVLEKTNNLGSDKVRHKPGCTVTEDNRLEILD